MAENIVVKAKTVQATFGRTPDAPDTDKLSLIVTDEADAHRLIVMIPIETAKNLRWFLNDNARRLRPTKDWANCSYEGHSDDCDCRGMGGDR